MQAFLNRQSEKMTILQNFKVYKVEFTQYQDTNLKDQIFAFKSGNGKGVKLSIY